MISAKLANWLFENGLMLTRKVSAKELLKEFPIAKACDHSVVMAGETVNYKRKWCGKCGATL